MDSLHILLTPLIHSTTSPRQPTAVLLGLDLAQHHLDLSEPVTQLANGMALQCHVIVSHIVQYGMYQKLYG